LFWDRVTNKAFTWAAISAFAMFLVTRFELVAMDGVLAVFFELCAAVGGGVVIGLMAFGFFGRRVGILLGTLTALTLAPFAVGFLRDYSVLLSSLTAYGVSMIVCVAISLRNQER